MTAANKRRKKIDLGLQGGGSHGAYTWGVLDRLLADERLEIEGVSGASAGALNAVALADGFDRGGRAGARASLDQLWRAVSSYGRNPFMPRSPWSQFTGDWGADNSPFLFWMDFLSHYVSPYDLNPLNWNPLRDILEQQIDFKRLRETPGVPLYITATNVETGRPRVFQRHELTVDHILASACLPNLYQAIIIEGAAYWDGGYMGNPSLWPLFDTTDTDDILIVGVNPIERKGAPRTTREIFGRLNEITFNASLLSEFRAIDFVQRLIQSGRLAGTNYHNVRVHMIADDALMASIGETTKYVIDWSFLQMMHEKGAASADDWL
ncbi:MAG: patatin-like phospholipase family protein, partial [Hyphomonadaceae bacterium]